MKLAIEGMHCGACVRRVKQALEGAGAASPEVRIGEAEVHAPAEQAAALVAAVEKAGYPARVTS
jgi:copper chaperone